MGSLYSARRQRIISELIVTISLHFDEIYQVKLDKGVHQTRVALEKPSRIIIERTGAGGFMNASTDIKRRYRTIWISDIHLGTRGCKADDLLDFLKSTESDTLYLVGDVIDGWRLRKSWYWPQSHNDVVQKLLRKARKGTRVVLVPGNHDEFARDYHGMLFGDIRVVTSAIHQTAAGKRLLIIHGDAFDGVVKHAKWLAHLGDGAYTLALSLNHWLNIVRRALGFPYWSLSAYLKHKVKNAVQYIANFEETMAEEARRSQADGVVCGHIHYAQIRDMNGILYCNDGDWVESCTALVENFDGSLEILHWLRAPGLYLQNAALTGSQPDPALNALPPFGAP